MFNDDNYNLNNLNSQEDYYFSNDNNSFSDRKISFKERKKFDPKWVIIGLLVIAIIVIIVLIFSDNGDNDTVAVITYSASDHWNAGGTSGVESPIMTNTNMNVCGSRCSS